MPVTESRVTTTHPEMQQKRERLFKRIWDGLIHPVIRLPIEFPWGLKEFSRLYGVAAVFYVLGSVIPLLVIFAASMVAIRLWPQTMVELLVTPDDHPSMPLVLGATLASFAGGFGAELIYFNHQLKRAGLSLFGILHVNLRSLNGSWWEAIKRSFFALFIGLAGQDLIEKLPFLPRPHQATADMAAGLHGGGLLAFAALAALMAPFFEEIIFRGIIFSSFRKIFREGRLFKLIGGQERFADYWAVALSAAFFAGAHLDPTAFPQLFLLGVLLAELYRRSGTLICPMLLHALNNLVATALIVGK